MPVTTSAKKALRRDRRRKTVNLRIKKKMKTALRRAKEEPTKKSFSLAYSAIDRAVKKKVIHKNKAVRLKSRLSKSFAKGS